MIRPLDKLFAAHSSSIADSLKGLSGGSSAQTALLASDARRPFEVSTEQWLFFDQLRALLLLFRQSVHALNGCGLLFCVEQSGGALTIEIGQPNVGARQTATGNRHGCNGDDD